MKIYDPETLAGSQITLVSTEDYFRTHKLKCLVHMDHRNAHYCQSTPSNLCNAIYSTINEQNTKLEAGGTTNVNIKRRYQGFKMN